MLRAVQNLLKRDSVAGAISVLVEGVDGGGCGCGRCGWACGVL